MPKLDNDLQRGQKGTYQSLIQALVQLDQQRLDKRLQVFAYGLCYLG